MRHFFSDHSNTARASRSLTIMILLLTLLAIPPLQAATFEKTYGNGLKLIVREDRRAPVVVSQIWYKVGSSYEHMGITGISHALEHMMFKATEKTASGEFSRLIAENGGSDNAFTGKHYTAYYQRIGSDSLELCLRLEADRMKNLLFNADEFQREMEVIKEERNLRVDNNPLNRFYEHFIASVFLQSPLRNPTIGLQEDLDQLQLDEARQWYQRWYSPNNATLVIVGDVEFAAVDNLVQKYFGDIESKPLKAVKLRPEPPQNGLRQIHGYGQTSSPYLLMAYRVPVLKQLEDPADAYALDVLAGILDGGSSARFMQFLQRGEELAVSVSAGYDAFERLEGLFTLSGTPKPEVTLEKLQIAIDGQIKRLKQELVNDEELTRVKAQVVSGRIYQQDSMFGMAVQIGMLETSGIGWRLLDDYVIHIQQVNAEDVQRVARRYFNSENLTLGKFWPEQYRP